MTWGEWAPGEPVRELEDEQLPSMENRRDWVVARATGKLEGDNVIISTVFLGLDHGYGDYGPRWFETMVFPADKDGELSSYREQEMDRYPDEQSARAGHQSFVDRLTDARDVTEEFKASYKERWDAAVREKGGANA